jgi:hypothetical protein
MSVSEKDKMGQIENPYKGRHHLEDVEIRKILEETL